MSLAELFKSKPPKVNSCSDSLWPVPEKRVNSSTSPPERQPFLSNSPLWARRRGPSLREFLNPNYVPKHKVQAYDTEKEPIDLLSNLQNSGLSKAELLESTKRTASVSIEKNSANRQKGEGKASDFGDSKTTASSASSASSTTCQNSAQKSCEPTTRVLRSHKERASARSDENVSKNSPKIDISSQNTEVKGKERASKRLQIGLNKSGSNTMQSTLGKVSSTMINDIINSVVKDSKEGQANKDVPESSSESRIFKGFAKIASGFGRSFQIDSANDCQSKDPAKADNNNKMPVKTGNKCEAKANVKVDFGDTQRNTDMKFNEISNNILDEAFKGKIDNDFNDGINNETNTNDEVDEISPDNILTDEPLEIMCEKDEQAKESSITENIQCVESNRADDINKDTNTFNEKLKSMNDPASDLRGKPDVENDEIIQSSEGENIDEDPSRLNKELVILNDGVIDSLRTDHKIIEDDRREVPKISKKKVMDSVENCVVNNTETVQFKVVKKSIDHVKDNEDKIESERPREGESSSVNDVREMFDSTEESGEDEDIERIKEDIAENNDFSDDSNYIEETSSSESACVGPKTIEKTDDDIEILVFKNDSDEEYDDDGCEEGEIEEESEDNQALEATSSTSEIKTKKWKRKRKRKGKETERKFQKHSSSDRRRPSNVKLQKTNKEHYSSSLAKPVLSAKDETSTEPFKQVIENQEQLNKDENEEQGYSLLSFLEGTTVDVTVAASEKELVKKKTRGGKTGAKYKKKLQRRMNAFLAKKREELKQTRENRERLRPLCNYYLRPGSCNKGEMCPFRHEGTPPAYIKEVCKYYVASACMKGDTCQYVHGSFPCKYFHKNGFCRSEDHCRFSHDPLTEETKAMLDKFLIDEEARVAAKHQTLEDPKANLEVKPQGIENTQPEDKEKICVQQDNLNSTTNPAYTVRYGSLETSSETELTYDANNAEDTCPNTLEKEDTLPQVTYLVPGMYLEQA